MLVFVIIIVERRRRGAPAPRAVPVPTSIDPIGSMDRTGVRCPVVLPSCSGSANHVASGEGAATPGRGKKTLQDAVDLQRQCLEISRPTALAISESIDGSHPYKCPEPGLRVEALCFEASPELRSAAQARIRHPEEGFRAAHRRPAEGRRGTGPPTSGCAMRSLLNDTSMHHPNHLHGGSQLAKLQEEAALLPF